MESKRSCPLFICAMMVALAKLGPDVFKTPSAEEEAAGMVQCLQRGCAWYNVRRERCGILERIP